MEVGFSKDLSLFQLNDHPNQNLCLIEIILFLHLVQIIWLNILKNMHYGLKKIIQKNKKYS